MPTGQKHILDGTTVENKGKLILTTSDIIVLRISIHKFLGRSREDKSV